MRNYLVAAAMALTAFAGQAMASSTALSAQSSVESLGLRASDRATADAEGSDQLLGLSLVPSIAVVLLGIATLVAVTEDDDNGTSAST